MTARALSGQPGELRLDAGEYRALWRHVVRADQPPILAVPDHGGTHAESDALDAAAWRRLRERDLVDAAGAPDPALSDVLAVVARPDAEIDAHAWTARSHHGTFACARGDLGAVAALDGSGGLEIGPAPPGDLAGALLSRLPAVAPLPGIPMTLPAEAFRTQGRDPASGGSDPVRARERRLRRTGVPGPAIERLAAMWAESPRRRWQFGVARRDALGRRHRGPTVLDVVDTVAGRVLLAPTGRQLLVRPVDDAWLREELHRLLATVATA